MDDAIRNPAVTALVSAVSALPEVREWVNRRLRAIGGAGRSLVADGRDIGTVVFPEARLKIFLVASPLVRATRRLAQRAEPIDRRRLDTETARLAARDQADSERAIAPLRQAEDAVALDTTDLSFEAQVERILTLWRGRHRVETGGARG